MELGIEQLPSTFGLLWGAKGLDRAIVSSTDLLMKTGESSLIGGFSLRISRPIVFRGRIARSTAGVLGERNELILIPRNLARPWRNKRAYEYFGGVRVVSKSAIIFL